VGASDIRRDMGVEWLVLSSAYLERVLELGMTGTPGVEDGRISLQLYSCCLQLFLVGLGILMGCRKRSIA